MVTEIIPPPRKTKTPERADQSKHDQYHKNHGHHTKEYVALKDRIEELIQAGQLKCFVKDGGMRMRQSLEQEQRGRKYVERREERPERRDIRKIERNEERRERRVERRNERSYHSPQRMRKSRERSLGRPVRGFINTISRGFSGGEFSAQERNIGGMLEWLTMFSKVEVCHQCFLLMKIF